MRKSERQRHYPPDYVSAETLHGLMGLYPEAIDQLSRSGLFPKPRKVFDLVRWRWSEVAPVLAHCIKLAETKKGAPVYYFQPPPVEVLRDPREHRLWGHLGRGKGRPRDRDGQLISREVSKRKGGVYFARAGGHMKIGYTTTPVQSRMAGLQTGSPVRLTRYAFIPGARSLEKIFHKALASYRVQGEWFHLGPNGKAAADELIRAHGGKFSRGRKPK